MKHLFLMIAFTGLTFAQAPVTAKMDQKTLTAPTAPAERPLTKEESLGLQLTQTRIVRLQEHYKISEYQAAIQSIGAEGQAIFTNACRSIGIPEDKIATECQYNTGVDADGKPIMGADGKPLAARVWWEVPKETK